MGNADVGTVFDIITRFGKIAWREDTRAVEDALSEVLKRSLRDAGREGDYDEAKRLLPSCWRLSFAAGLQDAVAAAIEEAATLAHIQITSDKHDRWKLVNGSADATRADRIRRLCDIGRVEPVKPGERRAKKKKSESLIEALAEIGESEKFFKDVRREIETCLRHSPKKKPTMSAVAKLMGIGSRAAGGYDTGSPTLSEKLLRLAGGKEKGWKSGKEVFAALVAEVERRIEQKAALKSDDFSSKNTSK